MGGFASYLDDIIARVIGIAFNFLLLSLKNIYLFYANIKNLKKYFKLKNIFENHVTKNKQITPGAFLTSIGIPRKFSPTP
jgi:hypothetical protein